MAVFGSPGPAISRSAIVHDPFDEEAFQQILPKATGLRLLLNESELPLANELAFDLFCSFYKYFVKLRSPTERHRTRRGMVRRRRTRDASAFGIEIALDAGYCPEPSPSHDRAALWALSTSGAPGANPSRDAREPRGRRLRPRR